MPSLLIRANLDGTTHNKQLVTDVANQLANTMGDPLPLLQAAFNDPDLCMSDLGDQLTQHLYELVEQCDECLHWRHQDELHMTGWLYTFCDECGHPGMDDEDDDEEEDDE